MTIKKQLELLKKQNEFLLARMEELSEIVENGIKNPHSKIGNFDYWDNVDKVFDGISKTWKHYAIYKD